jgi:flagellar biosynthesis chaperone FliJ
MKRFDWPLQRVLDVRKKQEQKKIMELFILTQQLAATHSEVLLKQKMLEEIISSFAGKNINARLAEQEFFLSNSKATNRQIKNLKEQIRLLEPQQKEKMNEVLTIRRFRQGLEKMREKAKIFFIKEMDKLEQKSLDEAATVSFVRSVQNQENSRE